MSTEEKYFRELKTLSENHPLRKKSPQELCAIAFDRWSPNRISAIQRLKNYTGDAVTRVLGELAGIAHSFDVRQAALNSLTERQSPVAIQAFEECAQDENPEVRKSAIQAARYSSSEAVRTTVLLHTINDEDTNVREMADEVFFRLPGPEF